MNAHRSRKSTACTTLPRRRHDADPDGAQLPDLPDLLSAARKVTERTRKLRAESAALGEAQRAIQEANERFADLYDFVPIPYLILSDVGVIRHANESALQFFGGAREWVVGRPLIAYVDHQDMRGVLDRVLRSPKDSFQSSEVRLRARDGIRVVRLIARRRHRDEPGSPATFHIAIMDLTEVRRLEEERRRAERERQHSQEAERVARAASESKDEFLAMLSHELRTPLTPILAAADALVAHRSLPPDLTARLDVIRRNVKVEARLIDDLLDVARITKNKLEVTRHPIDLHRLLADTLDAWRAPLGQHHLELHAGLDARVHWVNGDAVRLGQVFRNVIANAVRFSEAGGRIRVGTEEHDGRIRVTVADTGAGMSAAQMATLFRPFVGRRDASSRHGLGLGLVISHAIMEAHEGTLQVWSAGPGDGTTVRLELPTVAMPSDAGGAGEGPLLQPAAAPEPVSPQPVPVVKILLVEDDPDSAEMLALLLSSEGFEVQTARSLHQARALVNSCEVIVSDIALPDGSGLDLMRGIRAQRPMRGIALSGYGSRQDVQRSLDAGFEEHLTKPVDLDQLVAAVRRLATPR